MGGEQHGTTTTRLVRAASRLFAERGFHRTTMRDIAALARVNLAAAHYHYGSKKALYLEVLRAEFDQLRALLARRRAAPPAAQLARLPRAKLIELFRARCDVMLETMIGAQRGVHADLMVREMADPSEALPVIVDELIRPLRLEMEDIVRRIAPALTRAQIERCAYSVVGQVVFYHFMKPVVLRFMGLAKYPPGLTRELAAHVTEFSVGGMERLASARRSRRGR